METIDIYYHCHCINDYRNRFKKTFTKIKESGLYDIVDSIFVCCDGNFEYEDDKFIVTQYKDKFSKELPTLKMMKNNSLWREGKVLYLHSKGVSDPHHSARNDKRRIFNRRHVDNIKYINDWIDYMEYFCIFQHKGCLETLEECDVTGVNFYTYGMDLYFLAGNFWWSTYDHIKGTPLPNNISRVGCEQWISSLPEKRYMPLHNSYIDHFKQPYPSKIYDYIKDYKFAKRHEYERDLFIR